MSNVGTTENFTGSTSLLGLKVAVNSGCRVSELLCISNLGPVCYIDPFCRFLLFSVYSANDTSALSAFSCTREARQ